MGLLGYLILPLLSLFTLVKGSEHASEHKQSSTIRSMPNTAFGVGERLVFDISYGFVTAGHAVMVIPGYKYVSGRKAYEINTYAVSTSAFDNVFKVRGMGA